ncbi:MAG: hypothetical protein P4L84_33080 [Isosphaeraceae bacterium]|nr:hypothetical protein [Isosphaeraceae bacterium]
MRLPRFRVRTLMIAVAVVAVACGWLKLFALTAAPELERLEALRGRLRADEWDWQFTTSDSGAYGAGENLYFVICPDNDGDRQAAEEFWQVGAGDGARGEELMSNDGYVKGFAEGALSVWGEVKSEL